MERIHSALGLAYSELRAAHLALPNPSFETRGVWLTTLLDLVRSSADDVAEAISEDFGSRSHYESKMGEIWTTVSNLKFILAHLRSWMEPESRAVQWPLRFGRAQVRRQPKGVVGIIAPWNYPFMLAIEPLAGALAAGNRVILKLSEHTPRTSALLTERLEQAFSREVLRVFSGGPKEGSELSELPLDHLLFTGGSAVGTRVYQAAAKNLVPVTLELGGKSPAILHPSYSIEQFAGKVLSGKCFSAGQTCIAPDYLLVPAGTEQQVVAAFTKVFPTRYPDLVNNPDYSAIASAARRDRIVRLVDDAVRRGAEKAEMNPRGESFEETTKLPLTLLWKVPDEALVLEEEVFGPVLPVVPYQSLDEAIEYVNKRPRPLALYYFDDDHSRAERILRETISGGVTINETLLHFISDDLPRAGSGRSGHGSYHGRASFETFSHQKSVFYQSRLNAVSMFLPPYGPRLEWLLHKLIG